MTVTERVVCPGVSTVVHFKPSVWRTAPPQPPLQRVSKERLSLVFRCQGHWEECNSQLWQSGSDVTLCCYFHWLLLKLHLFYLDDPFRCIKAIYSVSCTIPNLSSWWNSGQNKPARNHGRDTDRHMYMYCIKREGRRRPRGVTFLPSKRMLQEPNLVHNCDKHRRRASEWAKG